MYLICEGSAKAPEVALEIAQHASFLVLKSAFWRMLMRGGMMLLLRHQAGSTCTTACDSRIDNGLNLTRAASGDVGDGPTSFLSDTLLGRGEKREQGRERTRGDNNLGLEIVTGHNVSDGSQGRGLDRRRVVHQQVDQPSADAALDNGLDLVVGTV